MFDEIKKIFNIMDNEFKFTSFTTLNSMIFGNILLTFCIIKLNWG